MLQRACGQKAEDMGYQEGTLACHLRNFTEEVAEGERYAAASPGTDKRTALFPSRAYKTQ